MTGFRDWARAILGPEDGDQAADDFAEALGREFDTAILYGTEQENRMPKIENRQCDQTAPHDPHHWVQAIAGGPPGPTPTTTYLCGGLAVHSPDRIDQALAALPPTDSEAETLGLLVGAAYGAVLAERDQAREAADNIAEDLSNALRHLAVLAAHVPEDPSSFARDNHDVDAARAFLAGWQDLAAVDSDHSPEQEN